MASSVRVLLPSFGYTYTFTGVLSVKHPSSVSPSTYFLMDSHSKSMYIFRAMFLPVCGNPCVFFGKTREKSDNLLPHLRIQRI